MWTVPVWGAPCQGLTASGLLAGVELYDPVGGTQIGCCLPWASASARQGHAQASADTTSPSLIITVTNVPTSVNRASGVA